MKFLVQEHLSKRHLFINLVFHGILFLVALVIFFITLSIASEANLPTWSQLPLRQQLIPLMPVLFMIGIAYWHWASYHQVPLKATPVQVIYYRHFVIPWAIALLVLGAPALLFNLWFPHIAQADGIALLSGEVIAGFLLGNLMLIWWLIPLKALIRYLKLYWRHVKVIGRFDQLIYHPGDTVKLRVDSREALVKSGSYRVHFQYVQESWLTSGKKSGAHREFPHRESVVLQPAELAEKGTNFVLPTEAFFQDWANRLDDTENPSYWEILLEEALLDENDLVIARFLVPVVVSG